MLTVAPRGRTKLVTAGLTRSLSSQHSIVTGSVAEEDEVEKPTSSASFMALRKPKNGSFAPKRMISP